MSRSDLHNTQKFSNEGTKNKQNCTSCGRFGNLPQFFIFENKINTTAKQRTINNIDKRERNNKLNERGFSRVTMKSHSAR